MRLKATTSRSPIGLDIGSRRIHAVQLARMSRGWKLAAAASVPHFGIETLTDAQAVSRLCDSLGRLGFTGRRMVLALPRPSLVASTLDVPSAGIPVNEIAHVELARRAGCTPDQLTSTAWRLPGRGSEPGTQAMGVGCRNTDANTLLDPFESEKCLVDAIDYEGGAMLRACRLLTGAGRGVVGLVNLDWSSALLVLGFQQTVVYQRVLPELGLDQVASQLKERADIDDELASYIIGRVGFGQDNPDDRTSSAVVNAAQRLFSDYVNTLVDEVQTSFQYARHTFVDQSHDPQVLLCGVGAAVPGMGAEAGRRIGYETRVVTPSDLVSWTDDIRASAHDPAMVTAVGLAQYFGEDQ